MANFNSDDELVTYIERSLLSDVFMVVPWLRQLEVVQMAII